MKKLMILLTASLLIGATQYASTQSISDSTKADKLERAKKAEERGDLERLHKDNALALSYYQSALQLSRKNALLYNKTGIIELQLGDRGMARKYFSQALKLDPKMNSAVNNLGAVALLERKYKPAVNYFKQALAMDETVASTHVNLAEAWIGMNEINRAMTEYARALELDADLLSESQDGSFAQIATPEQRARVAYMIAKAYLKRGNVEGALESLRRAKELHYPGLSKVYTDPDFTALWQDPRLAKIVKK